MVLGDRGEQSRSTRLGHQLKAQRGRVYGELRIELATDFAHKGRSYRLVRFPNRRGEGDLGGPSGDPDKQRPPSQTTEKDSVTEIGGTLGTFSEAASNSEQNGGTPLTGSVFLLQSFGSPTKAPKVPRSGVSGSPKTTCGGGPSGEQGPPEVPQGPPRCAGSPPRECAACGSPDFVLDALDRYVCADCPSAASSVGDGA